jgi:hypothetical protein
MDSMEAALDAISRGILSVDSEGHVWSLVDRSAKTMMLRAVPRRAERRAKTGYSIVHFWLDGRQYLVTAHRLVWTVLNGPIPAGMAINHIDGWKTNNAPSNLEVVTPAENIRHAVRTGLRSYTNLARDLGPKARELRAVGLSYAAIAHALGVSQGTAFRAVSQSA